MERSQSIDCPGLRDLFYNLRHAEHSDEATKIENQIIEIADSWTALHVLETTKKMLEEQLAKFNMLAEKVKAAVIPENEEDEEDDDADMDDEPTINVDLHNMLDYFAKHAPAEAYSDFMRGDINFGELLKAVGPNLQTEFTFQAILRRAGFEPKGKVRKDNWEHMKGRNITRLIDYLRASLNRIPDDGEGAEAEDADEWGQIHDALEAFATGRASNANCDSFVAGNITFGQLLQTFGTHKNASVTQFKMFLRSAGVQVKISPTQWARMKERTIGSLAAYLVDLLVEPAEE